MKETEQQAEQAAGSAQAAGSGARSARPEQAAGSAQAARQRTLILGLGISGVVAARHALACGHDVVIYAGASSDKTRAAAREFTDAGVEVIFDTEDVEGSYDLCVACPGIPATGTFYASAKAASAELISEPEYAWRFSPDNWVAVSGTNGKTTTTALIAHILRSCGIGAFACGNTQQQTCTEACELRAAGEAVVAEVSSYQLASTVRFAPRVAVLLNIASDHLAWHGGQEAYEQAKLELFAHLGPGSCAVIDESVPNAGAVADELASRGVGVTIVGCPHAGGAAGTGGTPARTAGCAYADADGRLFFTDGAGAAVSLGCVDDLKIRGIHDVSNALAAAAAAIAYGCPADGVKAALSTFEPLEHRIEPCGEVDGVAFFNDSKATNVDATLKALTAFPDQKVVAMLGGRDKKTDLSELVSTCEDACSAVVVYGEAAERFAAAFCDAQVPCVQASGMREAFEAADAAAACGEVVLLSPACASFDEFSGFAERGRVFKELVAAKGAQQGSRP